MRRSIPVVIASALFALSMLATGCHPAPTGDNTRWYVLPTAAEGTRAFKQMPGLTGGSCRKVSVAQMTCYSKQTGEIYAGGHVGRDDEVEVVTREHFPRLRTGRAVKSGSWDGQLAGSASGKNASMGGKGISSRKALT